MRLALAVIGLVVTSACGTYSMIRPADTLPKGKVELAAGLAASSLEVNTIVHGAFGLTDRVELLGQNEVWNTFGEVRYAVRRRGEGPLAVSIGLGGGYAITLLSAVSGAAQGNRANGAAGTASVAVGHDWGRVAVTVGNRSFVLAPGYLATSTRAGIRVRIAGPLGALAELGATYHAKLAVIAAGLAIAEGSLGLFFEF